MTCCGALPAQSLYIGPTPKQHLSGDNAGVMDFVYSVTHDLRSPLVNIRALAFELRLVMKELEPLGSPGAQLDEEQARLVSKAVATDIPATLGHLEECVSRMTSL